MQQKSLAHLTVAVLAVLTSLTWPAGVLAQDRGPVAGDTAPDFAGKALNGDRVLVSAFAGKVVVLSYWASWCGPCKKELPLLEGIQEVAGKDRIQVVAVNIEAYPTYKKLAQHLSSLQMTIAHDTYGEGSKAYGVNGIPHMVIIGRDGKIIRVNRGYSEESVDRVIEDVNRALATAGK